MASLNSAYSTKTKALSDNLSSTFSTLADTYNNSKQSVQSDAASSLQQAYINKMLSQRNLNQNLTAQGLSGGASESAMASLLNNYGNSRNSIQTTENTNLSNLESTYNGNVASAQQEYNSALATAAENLASYKAQLESDLANSISSSYASQYSNLSDLGSSYLSAMQNALADQQAYEYSKSAATNSDGSGVNASSIDTGTVDKTSNRYSQLLGYSRKLKAGYYGKAATTDEIISQLTNAGASAAEIKAILNGYKDTSDQIKVSTPDTRAAYWSNHQKNTSWEAAQRLKNQADYAKATSTTKVKYGPGEGTVSIPSSNKIKKSKQSMINAAKLPTLSRSSVTGLSSNSDKSEE